MSTQFRKISYLCKLGDSISFSNLVIYIFFYFSYFIYLILILYVIICRVDEKLLSGRQKVCMPLGLLYRVCVYSTVYSSLHVSQVAAFLQRCSGREVGTSLHTYPKNRIRLQLSYKMLSQHNTHILVLLSASSIGSGVSLTVLYCKAILCAYIFFSTFSKWIHNSDILGKVLNTKSCWKSNLGMQEAQS